MSPDWLVLWTREAIARAKGQPAAATRPKKKDKPQGKK